MVRYLFDQLNALLGRARQPTLRHFLPGPQVDNLRFFASESELPDPLPRDLVAVIGSEVAPKWALLDCPCRRGHVLRLSLRANSYPRWRIASDAGMHATISPSVDSTEIGERCHFWLWHGQVFWVGDTTSIALPTRLRRI